ncbi:MAG: beta-phosphoglucomutase [Anaerolineae bacterium]|nr:beta-phosphoglucomutase [Anaerolineae bacterium]
MKLQALIFDMDGVITDTIKLHDRAWAQLALEENVPYTRAESDAIRGLSREDSILHIFRHRSLDDSTIQTMMARKNHYFLDYLQEMTPADVLPGVRRLIEEARAEGWKVGLASSSRNVEDVLAKLDIRQSFDAIADAYTVARTKPAPDVFLWTAGRLGISPHEALILEDSSAGVEAALTGGFFVVGLGDPALVGAAHHVLPNLGDAHLAELLQAITA